MQVKPAALDFPIEKWVSKQHAHIELIDQVVVDVVVLQLVSVTLFEVTK